MSQDFSKYYQYVDSIEYYSSLDIINSDIASDNLYRKCFEEYRAFPGMYSSALITSYKVHNKLCDSLIVAFFRAGAFYTNLVYELEKNHINFSKKALKKLKRRGRKLKTKSTVSGFPIYRMIIKDQFSRRKSTSQIQRVDSLNAVKLRKLLKAKPDLFNYQKTGPLTSVILEILLFHGEWKNIEPIQKEIHDLIKKGHINRNVLAYLIERNAVSDAYEFRLDSLQNKVVATKNLADSACHGYYSSIAYEWGGVFDSTKNSRILPPLHPKLKIDEINTLRKYLFLSDLNLLYATKKYASAKTVEEYCPLIEAKHRNQIKNK